MNMAEEHQEVEEVEETGRAQYSSPIELAVPSVVTTGCVFDYRQDLKITTFFWIYRYRRGRPGFSFLPVSLCDRP